MPVFKTEVELEMRYLKIPFYKAKNFSADLEYLHFKSLHKKLKGRNKYKQATKGKGGFPSITDPSCAS